MANKYPVVKSVPEAWELIQKTMAQQAFVEQTSEELKRLLPDKNVRKLFLDLYYGPAMSPPINRYFQPQGGPEYRHIEQQINALKQVMNKKYDFELKQVEDLRAVMLALVSWLSEQNFEINNFYLTVNKKDVYFQTAQKAISAANNPAACLSVFNAIIGEYFYQKKRDGRDYAKGAQAFVNFRNNFKITLDQTAKSVEQINDIKKQLSRYKNFLPESVIKYYPPPVAEEIKSTFNNIYEQGEYPAPDFSEHVKAMQAYAKAMDFKVDITLTSGRIYKKGIDLFAVLAKPFYSEEKKLRNWILATNNSLVRANIMTQLVSRFYAYVIKLGNAWLSKAVKDKKQAEEAKAGAGRTAT